ncbi:hypothetical protein L1049_018867 [Liquidambar formosana]|uniref:Staygreen protein domain-containing protein n=1 Tax=Liquidambar formosana TaxID=63359 RepID=A0AAP0RAR4_LIQFO
MRKWRSLLCFHGLSLCCSCFYTITLEGLLHQQYQPQIYKKIKNSSASSISNKRPSYNALVFEAARLLGPRARFEASKLKVVLMGEGMNGYSGITQRTYILSHCNLAANLTLTISNVINLDQLKGWYSKDGVVAEWKGVNGDMCLHVHYYVSGPNPLLDLAAEFRYHIFCKELPLVLTAVLHGDSVLFRERPELLDALVWAYFHSSSKKYNRMECWGPLKDAAEGRQGDQIHGLLTANKVPIILGSRVVPNAFSRRSSPSFFDAYLISNTISKVILVFILQELLQLSSAEAQEGLNLL